MTNYRTDPEEWIDELKILRTKLKAYKHEISDDALIAHIMGHLPRQYNSVVDMLHREINKGSFSLDDLQDALDEKYHRLTDGKPSGGSNDD